MKLPLNHSNTIDILPKLQSAEISVGRAIELLNEVLLKNSKQVTYCDVCNDWVEYPEAVCEYHGRSGLIIETSSWWPDYAERRANANEMKEVKSSNISHIGYNEFTKTLMVKFKSGQTYHYFNVPKDTCISLLNAESIGSYFAKTIKPTYQCIKVEQ